MHTLCIFDISGHNNNNYYYYFFNQLKKKEKKTLNFKKELVLQERVDAAQLSSVLGLFLTGSLFSSPQLIDPEQKTYPILLPFPNSLYPLTQFPKTQV